MSMSKTYLHYKVLVLLKEKLFFFVFFLFSFTSLSSFFTHIETNQSVGGAKNGVPGEKPPDTPASRTWLVPHVTRAPCEARTHSGEMIKRLRALKSATLTTRPRGPPEKFLSMHDIENFRLGDYAIAKSKNLDEPDSNMLDVNFYVTPF